MDGAEGIGLEKKGFLTGFPIKPYIEIAEREHGIALKELCPHATEVVKDLQDRGFEAYIVGGGVRDLLLGHAPKDFDVATNATPEQVHAIFPRCRLIGRRFRLAHVRKKGTLIEVATFRGQINEASDRQGMNGRILSDNVWGTVEEDAIRRDFTINAMFLDPVSGKIRDFVGGYDDLTQRRLRLIGDPEARYREDPVRLLRAARFVAKLGVEPEAATGNPIHSLAALLMDVPPARLFEEVCKLFLTGHGARSLVALQRFGLMQTLFPVLDPAREAGQVAVGPLLLKALENTDSRIADGKPITPAFFFAALFWPAMRERAEKLEADGMVPGDACLVAADEVFTLQCKTIAVPRRFSAVTKQIWVMQPRFNKTSGKRWKRLFGEQRFRAAYDFLLLRVEEDPSLKDLSAFWTQAQEGMPKIQNAYASDEGSFEADASPAARPSAEKPEGGRRRPRRRRRGGARF